MQAASKSPPIPRIAALVLSRARSVPARHPLLAGLAGFRHHHRTQPHDLLQLRPVQRFQAVFSCACASATTVVSKMRRKWKRRPYSFPQPIRRFERRWSEQQTWKLHSLKATKKQAEAGHSKSGQRPHRRAFAAVRGLCGLAALLLMMSVCCCWPYFAFAALAGRAYRKIAVNLVRRVAAAERGGENVVMVGTTASLLCRRWVSLTCCRLCQWG